MNVQELIDILSNIKDKKSDVRIETMRDRDDKYMENQWLSYVNVETLDSSNCDIPDYPNTINEIILKDYKD